MPPRHPYVVVMYLRPSCAATVAPSPKCVDIDTEILDR